MDPTSLDLSLHAKIFKALGHPSRLKIIVVLSNGSLKAGDLQKFIGCNASTLSQHLSILKNVGIVSAHKEGNQIFYHSEIPCVNSFLSCCMHLDKKNNATSKNTRTCQCRNDGCSKQYDECPDLPDDTKDNKAS